MQLVDKTIREALSVEKKSMREFFAVTGFPQRVRVLDGCNFPVSPPKKYASNYYNYKGWYMMILLALVNHRYRFRYTNVGSPGWCHDSFVYGRSKLSRAIIESLASPQLVQLPLVRICWIAEGFAQQVQLAPLAQLLQFDLNFQYLRHRWSLKILEYL
ncbi:hypothetical protein MRX96_026122 [Rhipicephalus microplus]